MKELNLQDAVETIEASIALGLTPIAPAGVFVYEVLTYSFDESSWIGIFNSHDAAEAALQNSLIKDLKYETWNPWNEDGLTFEEWMNSNTPHDFVTRYYKHYPGESSQINQIQVQGIPDPVSEFKPYRDERD